MKTTIKIIGLGLVSAVALNSCSDEFLQKKKNYDNVTSDIYNYYDGCNLRVNNIYGSLCLPEVSDLNWKYPSMGNADLASQATEEYSGFSDFVNPQIELTAMSSTNGVPDFLMGQASKVEESVYGRIRAVNESIEGISSGSIDQADKDIFLGQLYFMRAWCYYNLFKWYGGVPLVTDVQNPVSSSITPRATTKETYDFIMSDLDKAAKLLAEKTMNGGWTGTDYGRVTTGTALALKGRLLQLWCSPLFNRSDDKSRWEEAYKIMKAEKDSIDACGYGLYTSGNNVNGSTFASVFTQQGVNPEAVFVTLHNNVQGQDGLSTDPQRNSTWEKGIRPKNAGGSGKKPSKMIIDEFPMSDGKIPAGAGTYTKLTSSSVTYNSELPFMNRDPRFYRTFTFPGFRWAYNGDATVISQNNPADSKNYVLWSYVWYTDKNDVGNPESGSYYVADNLFDSKTGIYVRKKSDDLDLNSSPLYEFVGTDSKAAAPWYSAAQLLEIRYTEVLLNLAEVAAGAGHLDEAVAIVKQIRERAGYTGDCGITPAASSDRATCFAQILYERQIEFAYEGKRFDDLRRWMLFDGGTGHVEGAPVSWTLTGFDGNTCEFLGFKALNGQRRENIQYRVADKYGVGKAVWNGDPMLGKVERPAGVDLRKADLESQLNTLATWYEDNLKFKQSKGDAWDSNKNPLYMNFRPKYYFLGLSNGAQSSNPNIPQTIGWENSNNGGANGTFDPLAE